MLWYDRDARVITYTGENVKFQNGFGAWTIYHYECDYEIPTEKLLAVRVCPRSELNDCILQDPIIRSTVEKLIEAQKSQPLASTAPTEPKRVPTVRVQTALAQQTVRVAGTIDMIDGNILSIKSNNGLVTLKLDDYKALILGIVKASVADIKEGSYIGSGAVPQPDGTQKAVEVHIFHESLRGTGDGHHPGWPGAPNGTMTNGAVGQTVSGVLGPVLTVKYNGGEKKIIVGPSTPIVKYEIGDKSELKPGAAVAAPQAVKQPDGTFTAARLNVGRSGVVP
jgi:hypothetical protein